MDAITVSPVRFAPLVPRGLFAGGPAKALIAGIILTGLSFALSANMLADLVDARKLVAHSREVQSRIDDVAWDLLAIDDGLRSFVMGGSESELASCLRARAEIRPAIAALAALTTDGSQQRRVRDLEKLAQIRLEKVENVIALRRSGDLDLARQLALSTDDIGLRTAVTVIRRAEDEVLTQQMAREQREGILLLAALILSGVLAVALIIFAAAIFNRTLRARDMVLKAKEESLDEKDLLMREMDHRVGNSLNLIHSLLTFQELNVKDEVSVKRHLAAAANRVLTVARIHQRLHLSGTTDHVEMGDYLRSLCGDLAASVLPADQRDTVRVSACRINLRAARALSLGLIAAELITNALKYGAPDVRRPVDVTLDQSKDRIRLIVADHGAGLPDNFDHEASGGLGMQVIILLVRQLEGALEISRGHPGAKFVISVAADQPADHVDRPTVPALPTLWA